jgi:hypothetical protein
VSAVGESVAVGVPDAAPVPVNVAVCGEPVALSATATEALRAPLAVGLNTTLIAHEEDAATDVQLFVCEKSPAFAPVIVTPLTVNAAVVLELETVMVCAVLEAPTVCEANVSAVGDSVAVGVPAAAPVPFNVTVCGDPVALSAIDSEAVRAPLAVGLNVTLIVHCAFAPTLPPQPLVSAKSPALAPVRVTPVTVMAVEPLFVRVTVCAALAVPIGSEANVNVVGATPSVKPAAAPVPLKPTVCVVGDALSVIVMVAVREPLAPGLNVTLIVQCEFAATLPAQLSVSVKSLPSAPEKAMLEIVSAVELLFVNVTACAVLAAPTVCDANVSIAGDTPATGTELF